MKRITTGMAKTTIMSLILSVMKLVKAVKPLTPLEWGIVVESVPGPTAANEARKVESLKEVQLDPVELSWIEYETCGRSFDGSIFARMPVIIGKPSPSEFSLTPSIPEVPGIG